MALCIMAFYLHVDGFRVKRRVHLFFFQSIVDSFSAVMCQLFELLSVIFQHLQNGLKYNSLGRLEKGFE